MFDQRDSPQKSRHIETLLKIKTHPIRSLRLAQNSLKVALGFSGRPTPGESDCISIVRPWYVGYMKGIPMWRCEQFTTPLARVNMGQIHLYCLIMWVNLLFWFNLGYGCVVCLYVCSCSNLLWSVTPSVDLAHYRMPQGHVDYLTELLVGDRLPGRIDGTHW